MIRSFFEDAKDAASKFIGKYKNKEFMEAVMTACVMVAQADGVFDDKEKEVAREIRDVLGIDGADFPI